VLECVSFRDFTCSQYFLKNIRKCQIISCWLNIPLLACEAFLGSILGLGLHVIGLLGLLVHCYVVDLDVKNYMVLTADGRRGKSFFHQRQNLQLRVLHPGKRNQLSHESHSRS
jgi:hypothetical protein